MLQAVLWGQGTTLGDAPVMWQESLIVGLVRQCCWGSSGAGDQQNPVGPSNSWGPPGSHQQCLVGVMLHGESNSQVSAHVSMHL